MTSESEFLDGAVLKLPPLRWVLGGHPVLHLVMLSEVETSLLYARKVDTACRVPTVGGELENAVQKVIPRQRREGSVGRHSEQPSNAWKQVA